MDFYEAHGIADLLLKEEPAEKALNFLVHFPSYGEKEANALLSCALDYQAKGYQTRLIIETDSINFTDEDLSLFRRLRDELQAHGLDLFFHGGYRADYTLEELSSADSVLDEIIEEIREADFSPLERYLAIYRYLTSRPYKERWMNSTDDSANHSPDSSLERDLISVVNTDYIVCEGYANLMHYLCESLGIKSMFQALCLNGGNHANNLVFLEDEKYGVRGLYYADSCWDAVKAPKGPTWAFCLLPMGDYGYLRTQMSLYGAPLFYQVHTARLFDPAVEDVPYWLKEVGLEKTYPHSYESAVRLFLSHRAEATELLRKAYAERGYDPAAGFMTIPYGTEACFLIAALLLSKNNYGFVLRRIEELQRFCEVGFDDCSDLERPYYRLSYRLGSGPSLGEVSELLDTLPSFPFERHDLSKEHLNNIHDDESLDPSERLKLIYAQKIIEHAEWLLVLPKIEKEIAKRFPIGDPIPIEAYEKAFQKVLLQEGKSQSEAEAMTQTIVEQSSLLAKNAFYDGAVNEFYLSNFEEE